MSRIASDLPEETLQMVIDELGNYYQMEVMDDEPEGDDYFEDADSLPEDSYEEDVVK